MVGGVQVLGVSLPHSAVLPVGRIPVQAVGPDRALARPHALQQRDRAVPIQQALQAVGAHDGFHIHNRALSQRVCRYQQDQCASQGDPFCRSHDSDPSGMAAMASISHSAPFGRSFTATQLRAGRLVKYFA